MPHPISWFMQGGLAKTTLKIANYMKNGNTAQI
jgi:hypothetical protein